MHINKTDESRIPLNKKDEEVYLLLAHSWNNFIFYSISSQIGIHILSQREIKITLAGNYRLFRIYCWSRLLSIKTNGNWEVLILWKLTRRRHVVRSCKRSKSFLINSFFWNFIFPKVCPPTLTFIPLLQKRIFF